MSTDTLHSSPSTYAPGRTLAIALACALALEATLGWLALQQRASAPVAPPPVRVRTVRIETIADAPPPAPAPAEPAAPPQHPAAPAPPKARAAPLPTPAPDRSPGPAAPAAANPAPAAARPPAAPVEQPAAPTAPPAAPRIRPGIRRGVVPLHRVEPDYPTRALAENTEGSVTADLTIEPDGSVSNVRIVRANPPGMFEREAEKALRQWKFSATDSGIVGEVELDFTLN